MNPYESPAAVEDFKPQKWRHTVANILLACEMVVGIAMIIGVWTYPAGPKAFIDHYWFLGMIPFCIWVTAIAVHGAEPPKPTAFTLVYVDGVWKEEQCSS